MAAGQCPGTALDHSPSTGMAPSFVLSDVAPIGPDFTIAQPRQPVAKILCCMRCGLVYWVAM